MQGRGPTGVAPRHRTHPCYLQYLSGQDMSSGENRVHTEVSADGIGLAQCFLAPESLVLT